MLRVLFDKKFDALALGAAASLARSYVSDWETLRQLHENFDSKYVNLALVKNPTCPPEVIGRIYGRSNDNYVVQSTAANPNCPSEVLEHIYKNHGYSRMWSILAGNPVFPEHVLSKLAENNDWRIWNSIAVNPNCSMELLKTLSDSGSVTIFECLKNRSSK